MDRTALSDIAHRRHRVAAPVDRGRVRELLGWLAPPSGGQVLDLGSGHGAWLLELLAAREDLTGVGIDLSLPEGLTRATQDRDVGDRVRWEETDASGGTAGSSTWSCAWAPATPSAARPAPWRRYAGTCAPGGQVLLGDVFWEIAPTPEALSALGVAAGDVPDLAGLLAHVEEASFEPGFGHVSTLAEWDDYEWSWTGSLVDWALREAPTDADRDQALSAAREHRQQWLAGYRGVLGFATLVLHDVAPPQDTRP